MGNPLYGDDIGAMCFNPAKTWQLQMHPHANVPSSWYDSQDFITVDMSGGARVFRMIGIGEYNLQGDGKGNNNPRKAVVLQVKSASGPDQYIGFNSAKGANFQNDEADDQVSIFHTRPQYPDEISQDQQFPSISTRSQLLNGRQVGISARCSRVISHRDNHLVLTRMKEAKSLSPNTSIQQ